MRRRILASFVSCTFLVIAACSDDEAAPGGETLDADGGPGSSSGQSSSGSSSSSSSSGGDPSTPDGGGDPDPDPPVPVGDGSLGAGCNKDDECDSKICAVGHKCVLSPSCRGSSRKGDTPGVDTCGAAEPGDESCCTSLTLPKTKTRTLDKFEITSGRIRAFIASLPEKNLRKFAKDFAKANPTSELGKLATDFPGYLDLLPTTATGGDTQLPIWLGAFPNDTINRYDGCYVNNDGFGAATYWQDVDVLQSYGIGYNPDPNKPGDGKRKYSAAVLDTKPANCMPPVLLAAFCAWDGGELARPSDYHEIWGHTTDTLPKNEFGESGGKFTKPWAKILKPGEFNWRNGHGAKCPIAGWPGCDPNASEDNPPAIFFSFPKGGNPAEDDSPEIGAPGRFPKDVTAIQSPDGAGWFDVGGNLLEAAWPASKELHTATENFCDTTRPLAEGKPGYCNRKVGEKGQPEYEERAGTILFASDKTKSTFLPAVALIGASFEGHIGYGEKYFANAAPDEKNFGNQFAAHFQYGKVGGRCARTK